MWDSFLWLQSLLGEEGIFLLKDLADVMGREISSIFWCVSFQYACQLSILGKRHWHWCASCHRVCLPQAHNGHMTSLLRCLTLGIHLALNSRPQNHTRAIFL